MVAEPCERWIPGANIRRDLFHVGDVIACHAVRQELLLVQATSLSNLSARLRKAKEQPELRTWLAAGGKFEVWGWFKRSGRWQVKQVAVSGEDLLALLVSPGPRRRRRGPQQRELFEDEST
jgi:hypothetical protein